MIDDAGYVVQVNKPAVRIVSLSPGLTESIFAAGGGQYLVGVIRGSDYPTAAASLPTIGSYTGLDLEKIFSLHPDLVVTWGRAFPRQINALKKMGIPVYTSQPKQLEDIPRTLKNLGCLIGTQTLADQAAKKFSLGVAKLAQQYQTLKPTRVFYQIGAYSLLTINHESWINQVIELCGGRNVFADIKLPTAEVTWEAVIVANPEMIITDTQAPHWQARWQKWQMLAAVKNKKLFSIHPDIIDRPGPRLIEGAEKMCALIHSS